MPFLLLMLFRSGLVCCLLIPSWLWYVYMVTNIVLRHGHGVADTVALQFLGMGGWGHAYICNLKKKNMHIELVDTFIVLFLSHDKRNKVKWSTVFRFLSKVLHIILHLEHICKVINGAQICRSWTWTDMAVVFDTAGDQFFGWGKRPTYSSFLPFFLFQTFDFFFWVASV